MAKKGLAWHYMNLDMFGAPIGFNYGGGKGKYDTCIGATCSVIIFIFMIFYIKKEALETYTQRDVPIINTQQRRGFFTDVTPITQKKDEFYFGVAISSHTDYEDGSQSTQEFLKHGTISMSYT